MKKILLVITLLILSISTVMAANYPRDLYGDSNYPLIYAHMNGASYLDKRSVVLKQQNERNIIFAQNIVYASFKNDMESFNESLVSVSPAHTMWFYKPLDKNQLGMISMNIDGRHVLLPPYMGDDVAYVSSDNAEHWTPFYISVTFGYNMGVRNSFLLGYQIATGKSY